MTIEAIVMMIVAVAIIWGGLAVSATYMIRNPLPRDPHPHDDHDFHA